MMKPLILLNSAPDRTAARESFLDSYDKWEHKGNYDLRVIVERNSIHLLRQRGVAEDGLKRPIITIDDDMEFTAETNFEQSLRFLQSRDSIGMISNGWKFHKNINRAIKDEFVRRRLVFTGGGLVLSLEAQKVIASMQQVRYWSDNVAWSIETTRAGLQNYYYKGSIAIHMACRKGGRKELLKTDEYVHHPASAIKIGISGQTLIQTEKDIDWAVKKIDK